MNGFEKRTEEKKNKILDSAFELMNHRIEGDTMTIDNLSKHASVAKGTIFKYFGSKENLINEVYKKFVSEMSHSNKEIISENKPFEETLLAISLNKVNHFKNIEQSFYLGLMEHLTETKDDGLTLMMETFSKESHSIMLDLFHRGRKEGKIDLKYSDEFLLLYFQTLVEGLSNPKNYESLLPYTEIFSEVIIKGIAPKNVH